MSIRQVPVKSRSSPPSTRSSVDFPLPFAPPMPSRSPGNTVKSAKRQITWSLLETERLPALMMGSVVVPEVTKSEITSLSPDPHG